MGESQPPRVLDGVRVVELTAKGPAPFGVMMLADLGADVIRVDRPATASRNGSTGTGIDRGRRSIALDLKQERGVELLLRLVDTADVLVEAYRPGVAERLGFGPETCLSRNPRLVYARMTGWGQHGPLASTAGHDINFLSVAGALHPIGSADRPPPPPLNLVGDFGGGGTFLVIGVLAALFERERSGAGQVLDVAMVDGISSLLTAYHGLRNTGLWCDRREANIVDGGAPWYRAYATSDRRFVAVGCLEPAMSRLLLERLGLDPAAWPHDDQARWPELCDVLSGVFASRPRAHWEALFADGDACVSPVLSLGEAVRAPHLAARETFVQAGGGPLPRPAPRLSRTPARLAGAPPSTGQHSDEILEELGVPEAAREQLRLDGVLC